uniref:Uncharacterized protein n=1 Tax=Microcebus murinus TaxID=30608 RepID=A0A8C5YDW5_MICMU
MATPVVTKTAWKLQEIVAHAGNVSSLVLGKASGRLLATGGDDCRANLWSISKPNCIMSLTGHTSPVESVRLNTPEELIVDGSQSGSSRVWDLEAVVSCMEGEPGPVRSVLFNPDGCCLYSGCQDSLRVYGWEPERCFDVVLVNWGKVADLAICNDQLIGVAFSQSNVFSSVVDLTQVTRTSTVAQDSVQDSRPLPGAG